jgi:hypothetical protein
MLEYTRRFAAPLVLAAALLAGCTKKDSSTLAEDSALSRDLARVGTDSAAQPALEDTAAAAAPTPAPKSTTPTPRRTVRPAPTKSTPSPAPAKPSNVTPSGNTVSSSPAGTEKPLGTIAAGTTLALNSTEKVCTNTNKVGDRFVATVANTVTGENGASIPAGARVLVEVTKLKRSENTNDRIEMGFSVVSISFNGKTYTPQADIVTAEIDRVRNSSTGNDAKKVAGGAVVGAILGQVIGKDRKGTLIGAAAGAAAGGAAAAATANYEGCVNNGAPITIKLSSALTVAAS